MLTSKCLFNCCNNVSACWLTSWVFSSSPFTGSFLHFTQKRNSSVVSFASSQTKTDILTQSLIFIAQCLIFTFDCLLAPGGPPLVNMMYINQLMFIDYIDWQSMFDCHWLILSGKTCTWASILFLVHDFYCVAKKLFWPST